MAKEKLSLTDIPAQAGIPFSSRTKRDSRLRGNVHVGMAVLAGMTACLLFAFPAEAAKLKMDKSACQQLTRHEPAPDVAYQPGINAKGKKVVPADLNASPLNTTIADDIVIELNNHTAKAFGLNIPSVPTGDNQQEPLANPDMIIGYITFENGKPMLNGKPLDNSGQDELAVLCMGRK